MNVMKAAVDAAYERGRREGEAAVGELISRRAIPNKVENENWRWWTFWRQRYIPTGEVSYLSIYLQEAE